MLVKGKTIIVTGGGSGMGRELCLQLLQKEAKVIALDLNEKNLEETAQLSGKHKEEFFSYTLNVADKSGVDAFAVQVIQDHGHVDGLINNAGIIQPFIPVNDLDFDRIERIMNVNFYGTLYLTKAFLPHFLQRPEAHIANVASMGAFIPFPGQTFYGASKAAVKLLTEGLYAELQESKVGVTLIMPGAVNTNITANSGVEIKMATNSERAAKTLSAAKAATMMIDAIEKNQFRLLVGKDAKFLDLFTRFFPTRAIKFIVKQMKGMMK